MQAPAASQGVNPRSSKASPSAPAPSNLVAAAATTAVGPPPDVLAVHSLLKSMGVEEYEPRVVSLLLDFMYTYVTDVLQDAESFAENIGREVGRVEMDDVMLAVQSRSAYSFTQPPAQDIMAELAAAVNSHELKAYTGDKPGLLLPEEMHTLLAPNYRVGLGADGVAS